MKRTYVQIEGELVEYDRRTGERVAPDVMPDIKPYKSMVTGELITSRSRHREHLRDHGMVEVGNEPIKPPAPFSGVSQTRKELLIAQVNDMTHEQFKAAGKRDLDNLRWRTRQD